MTSPAEKTNLGRGLAALFGDEAEDVTPEVLAGPGAVDPGEREVPIEFLHPNPKQPRRVFDDTAMKELAQSIEAKGLLQPILVRAHPNRSGEYEIVAGERRWRAAQQARLHKVPVVVKALSDLETLEIALVENLQRQDLGALEEADAFQRLIQDFGNSQEDVARALGKSRSHVANTLRLLGLPTGVKTLLVERKISAGHARALLGADDPEALAQKVVAAGLSVRETEKLVKQGAVDGPKSAGKTPSRVAAPAEKDPDTLALERDLTLRLGLKVSIDFKDPGGSLTVHYQNLEQLDDLLQRLEAAM